MQSPVETFQTLTVLSSELLTSVDPSGENEIPRTLLLFDGLHVGYLIVMTCQRFYAF